MRKESTFLGLLLAVIFLSSCSATGVLVGVSTFGVVGYEVARHHNPDLELKPLDLNVGNLQFFSDQDPDQSNETVADNEKIGSFGFECSKLKNEKNQSECFRQFSELMVQMKSKAEQEKDVAVAETKRGANPTKKQKVAQTPKKPSVVVAKRPSPDNIEKARVLNPGGLPPSYLENWISAWEKQDVDLYLSFYSKKFKGLEKHRADWEASRQHALKVNKNISIQVRDVQMHQDEETIELTFTQNYKSDIYADTGIKELILEKNKSNWKIVDETWIPMEDFAADPKASVDPTSLVTTQLSSWLEAWENQDVGSYLSFYSKQFKSPKGNRSRWEALRHRALKANANLTIQASNLQISQSEEIIELNFIQTFKSDNYSDVGIKELVWSKNGNDWKILKETWLSS